LSLKGMRGRPVTRGGQRRLNHAEVANHYEGPERRERRRSIGGIPFVVKPGGSDVGEQGKGEEGMAKKKKRRVIW